MMIKKPTESINTTNPIDTSVGYVIIKESIQIRKANSTRQRRIFQMTFLPLHFMIFSSIILTHLNIHSVHIFQARLHSSRLAPFEE